MTKFIKGYRAVALVQILTSLCFFVNPGTEAYGGLYGVITFVGAGMLFFGSILAYFSPKRWTLWLMAGTMIFFIIFNSVWFIWHGVFISSGFPLIAYDCLFVVANLHFLGRGL